MIAIGCDHGGYYLKQDIIDFLEKTDTNIRITEHTAMKAVTILYTQKRLHMLLLTENAKKVS